MRQDNEYLRTLMLELEGVPDYDFNIRDIKKLGYDIEEPKFILHFRLLCDSSLIVPSGKDGYGFGYDGANNFSWESIVPLRLSATGHDFLAAVKQSEVWDKLKKEFSDASIKTLVAAGLKLTEAYAKKKVNEMLEN
ncbi:DUF2513 domain-containing protein [Psychromonas sp. SR45-3]|uniref:DUF2513 domain-containing protein n=1 Tax=Psychromonas sp. SR45-3 TaxID=2760930 RepID=UPI002175BE49|nr:DUF2513 domain-containing protein [Psychromonas sp. SR45-3]